MEQLAPPVAGSRRTSRPCVYVFFFACARSLAATSSGAPRPRASRGYSTTVEETTLEACSIAVPVRGPGAADDAEPQAVAAIGVVAHSLRRDRTRLLEAMRVTAQGIGRTIARRRSDRWPVGAPAPSSGAPARELSAAGCR